MDDRLVAIQRNPQSGSGPQRRKILDLVTSLNNRGFRPRLFSNRERLEDYLAEPHRRDNLACIVAAGGDGTVSDVINRFPGVPIAIFPMGTENLLARYLGVPQSGAPAAGMIASGRTRRLDLGLVNGRRFALMVSCGFDADVIHRLHAERNGHIRKLTYLQPILRSLRKYDYPEMRLFLDDSESPLLGRLALLANLPMYAMHLRPAPQAVGDDGLLDLRLFQRGSAFQMLRYIYKVACGRLERLKDVQTAKARRIRIESDKPVPIQLDGDPAGFTPAEIEILPGALEVFVPEVGSETS